MVLHRRHQRLLSDAKLTTIRTQRAASPFSRVQLTVSGGCTKAFALNERASTSATSTRGARMAIVTPPVEASTRRDDDAGPESGHAGGTRAKSDPGHGEHHLDRADGYSSSSTVMSATSDRMLSGSRPL